MRFDIPKVLKELNMSLYDQALADKKLQVWVNPNIRVQNEFYDARAEINRLVKRYDQIVENLKQIEEKDQDELVRQLEQVNEETKRANDRIYAWYSNILSQASDESSRVAPEELRRVANEDPALWKFIAEGTQDLIRAHQEGEAKK